MSLRAQVLPNKAKTLVPQLQVTKVTSRNHLQYRLPRTISAFKQFCASKIATQQSVENFNRYIYFGSQYSRVALNYVATGAMLLNGTKKKAAPQIKRYSGKKAIVFLLAFWALGVKGNGIALTICIL